MTTAEGFGSWSPPKFATPCDPIAAAIGASALENPSLQGLWTTLYNMPIVPYTRFNNTIVMGSFLFATVAAIPLYFLTRTLIIKYRLVVVSRIKQSYFARTVMATKAYRMYEKYRELRG